MKDSKVVKIGSQAQQARDALTEVLREGAQRMLAEAVEVEVEEFISQHAHVVDPQGRRRVVRNGYLPERQIQTGVGAVEVKAPRVRDKSGSGIRFTSKILPPYLRRTRSIEDLLRIEQTVLQGRPVGPGTPRTRSTPRSARPARVSLPR